MTRNVPWPTSSTPPKAAVGTHRSAAYVGVAAEDLEAVSFAFGHLMAQDALTHAWALRSLCNRIRLALEREKQAA